MSPRRALRVAVAGATGSLGAELLATLDARRFPVAELVPIATERSAGDAIEFQGGVSDIATDAARVARCDLAFVCAPPPASLELVRAALRAEVPCIDLSGGLAGQDGVPLLVADAGVDPSELARPVLAAPATVALALAPVLAPLAASAGRLGIEALSSETIALFNQQDPPDPPYFGRPVAFDCLPAVGGAAEGGRTLGEEALERDLHRLLGAPPGVASTVVRVPTFSGEAVSLRIRTRDGLSPEAAVEILDKARGVEVWRDAADGPSTRACAGRDVVLVGRVRADPSAPGGLLLWLVADMLQLAAANGVKLAEARLASLAG